MKRLLSALCIMLIAAAMQAQKVNFKIKGSDTCLPLSQKEAEIYMKNNPGSSITVVGGGSGVGFSALISGTTEMAHASRSIKMDEKIKLKEAGKAYKEVIIAYDALVVIIHPKNKIEQITREQLEGIFTGKITNWKEIGGDDMQIVVYSRETSSGTYEFFREHVLSKKNYAASALLMPATGAIVQSVSQTEGAIGYVGLTYVDSNVKSLKVSFDNGKTFIAPSIETAMNKSYPITRPLYYYYLATFEEKVKPYINFILSDEGQRIVRAEGFIPLK